MKKKLFIIASFAMASLVVSQAAFAETFKISSPETDSSISSLYNTRPTGAKDEWTSEIHSYDTVRHTEEGLLSKIKIVPGAKNAEVYIDDTLIGTNTVTVELEPGRHTVKVKKSLWDTREVTIRAVEDRDSYFYVAMEYIGGHLDFVTTPSNARVSVSGSGSSSSTNVYSSGIDLEAGTYTVNYICFGYKEMNRSVEVIPEKKRTVTATMDTVPFEYTRISTDRPSFNPKNGGKFGKIQFSIGVTAPGTGVLEVISPDQEIIYSEKVSFSDWNTYITWNGKTKDGDYAMDGQYTARVSSDNGKKIEGYFTIDSDISIPHLNITGDGSGLGSIASAQLFPQGTFQFSANFNANTSNQMSIDAGLLAAAGNHFELSGTFGAEFAEEVSFHGTLALKAGGSWKSATNTFWMAGTVNWGGTTEPRYYPYGADLGYGIGAGLMFGVKRNNLYLGWESEVAFGPVNGDFITGSDMSIKNGAMFQYEGSVFCFGVSASVQTGKGDYEHTASDGTLLTGSITDAIRAAQAEADFSLFLGKSGWTLDGKAGIIAYPTASPMVLYPYAGVGLSVTF